MHYQDRSPKGAGVHPFTALEEYVERRTGSSEVTLETMGIFACWDGCRSRGSASGGDHPREAGEGRRRRSGPDGQDRLGSWTRSSRSGVGGAAGGTAARRDACVRRLRGAAVAAVAVRTRECAQELVRADLAIEKRDNVLLTDRLGCNSDLPHWQEEVLARELSGALCSWASISFFSHRCRFRA